MKLIVAVALGALLIVAASGEQQRILRRVIKSTPTATNLARVRLVTVRSAGAERGAVSEISSQQAANFGQRAANETSSGQQQQTPTSTKTKISPSTTTSTPTTSSTTTTTTTSTTTPAAPTTVATSTAAAAAAQIKPKASERQQAAEVELMASAPSSWQTMTAVEAPAAALIAAGTRPAQAASVGQDLSSSSSEESNDFLRAGSSSKTSYSSAGETFSRLRQQSSKTSQQQHQQQQQQTFFYPQQQQQQRAQSKTSNYQQATKTHWYQPPATSTTPRPAPIIQEQQYEQYVEQQQVEAAPPGQAEPFAFDFNTQDNSGNGQYRKEESDKNGVVRGSYGYTDANGIYRHVEYVADHNGFRANIKSNEPGLIGETQPASIKMDGGPAPATSQRFTASNSVSNNENSDWTAASSSSNERADLALAPPDFESAHKSERLRAPRHFRN